MVLSEKYFSVFETKKPHLLMVRFTVLYIKPTNYLLRIYPDCQKTKNSRNINLIRLMLLLLNLF